MGLSEQKVFAIGWHKTATTSVIQALSQLGLHCLHGPVALYPSIAAGHADLRLLEPWGAVADMPIPLIVPQLQRQYPDARFLMTIRNEAAWLDSVEEMFRIGNEPRAELEGRSLWDTLSETRFIHQIHKLAYGATEFEWSRFLDRYRQHNDAVRRRFVGWGESYLEVDVSRGLTWEPLCRWLGLPAPKEPFPWLNVKSEDEWTLCGLRVVPSD